MNEETIHWKCRTYLTTTTLHLVLFRYREMNRAKLSEVNFGIKRLMEDLGKRMIINDIAADIANWKSFSDSGHSTLPGDDCDDLGR